jgi:hypothetical protein
LPPPDSDPTALVAVDDERDSLQLELEVAHRFRELEEKQDSLRNRLRAAADFWCAQWFSDGEDAPEGVVPCKPGDYEQVVGYLLCGDAVPDGLELHMRAARAVTEQRRFFHWALEFPEVMVERAGFDAVLGNPPWNTLSPDVKEFFATYDPRAFAKRGAQKRSKEDQQRRVAELRVEPDIDAEWRRASRFLHELSHYAKPESERFTWAATDPQLRKGDANVFRLFVERAFNLLRHGGHLGQVLPEAFYVSSPATGLRQRLLSEGRLQRCWVFENRREIFPIHRSAKVVLATAQRGATTDHFRAAFYVGKDAVGRDRTIGLEELPAVLATLDERSPELRVAELRELNPVTWSFPELQTALDAEIVARCVATVPPLNLDERGWHLTYCRELDADKDAWRFKDAAFLASERHAVRDGLRWRDPEGFEWWPLVEGVLFYHLEFPYEGRQPDKWVNGPEVAAIVGRRNQDGSAVTMHYRVAWRDVTSATNERGMIAAVLPQRTAAKHKAPTVWGGSLGNVLLLKVAALMSSFCFDYLVRFKGAISLTYGIVDSTPAPPSDRLDAVVLPTADLDAWLRSIGQFDEHHVMGAG